jgi:membrane protease YdiL (CAAX protease family)
MTLFPTDNSANRAASGSNATKRRWRDLLELSVGYGLILLVIWTPNPLQRWLYWAALIWILLVTALSFDGWKTMGLGGSGFWSSLWAVGVALLLAAASVTLASRLHTLHQPHGPVMFLKRFLGYVIWAFLQQFLLQDFTLLRLLRLLPGKKAAVIGTASLFALAHLPNPILTPAAAVWGFASCLLFLKYRNVYTLGMAHAIFGICIAIAVPGSVDHHMRVGLGYLTYHSRQHRHLSHSDHIVSTNAWVIADAPTRRC